ncbi:MAG: hypothetical protein U5L96_04830 [Owenweeksia sp.]|nr:hypothetical protein [Owenweeksia sp.]
MLDSCGAGDVSLWEGPLIASTECAAIAAPWLEDFEGIGWAPGAGATNNGAQVASCWLRPTNVNPDFNTGTGGTPSANTGPLAGYNNSNHYLYTEASGGAQGTGEIITPRVVISSSLTNPRLTFTTICLVRV